MNANDAKRHLLEVKQVFDSLNTKFWLWRGTLLGAVRDKKFIPWDHDVDLAILAKDWNRHLRKRLEVKGFRCTKGMYPNWKTWGFRLRKYQVKTDLFLQYYYPPDDVYIQLSHKNGSMDRFLTMAKLFRKDCFVEFLGQQFYVPDLTEEYLEWIYGKSWRTPLRMKRSLPHRFWKKNWKQISLDKYLKWFKEHPKND